jgi:hypothetical protein
MVSCMDPLPCRPERSGSTDGPAAANVGVARVQRPRTPASIEGFSSPPLLQTKRRCALFKKKMCVRLHGLGARLDHSRRCVLAHVRDGPPLRRVVDSTRPFLPGRTRRLDLRLPASHLRRLHFLPHPTRHAPLHLSPRLRGGRSAGFRLGGPPAPPHSSSRTLTWPPAPREAVAADVGHCHCRTEVPPIPMLQYVQVRLHSVPRAW